MNSLGMAAHHAVHISVIYPATYMYTHLSDVNLQCATVNVFSAVGSLMLLFFVENAVLTLNGFARDLHNVNLM